MKCRVIKDPATNEILEVKAPNGETSLVYKKLEKVYNNQEDALVHYMLGFTPEYSNFQLPSNALTQMKHHDWGEPIMENLQLFVDSMNPNQLQEIKDLIKGRKVQELPEVSVNINKVDVSEESNIKGMSSIQVSDDLVITKEISKEKYDSYDTSEYGNETALYKKLDENYDVFLKRSNDKYIKIDRTFKTLYDQHAYLTSAILDYEQSIINEDHNKVKLDIKFENGDIDDFQHKNELDYIYANIAKFETGLSRLKASYDSNVDKIKFYLSQYTDFKTIDSILQYLIRSNYEAQSEENIEIGKMLIKGIIENSQVEQVNDSTIINSPEFQAFHEANPNTTLEENLAYYKQCKL